MSSARDKILAPATCPEGTQQLPQKENQAPAGLQHPGPPESAVLLLGVRSAHGCTD